MMKNRLLIAAMMAMTMSEVFPTRPVGNRKSYDGPPFPNPPDTESMTRRAEKDAHNLAKAQAKRERKAQKRTRK